jgi:hypothetical protein
LAYYFVEIKMIDKRKDEMPEKIYICNGQPEWFEWKAAPDFTAYIRADLSPPVPDDVAESYHRVKDALVYADQLAEQDLTAWRSLSMQDKVIPQNAIDRGKYRVLVIKEAFAHLDIIRAASTPSSCRGCAAGCVQCCPSAPSAEVRALQKIPLSASTSGDFIAPDYIKGWNAAIEALNQISKSVINKGEIK